MVNDDVDGKTQKDTSRLKLRPEEEIW